MAGVLRPCTDEALKLALIEILEKVENAIATLTMKTALKLAEEKLTLKEGTLFDRKSEHKEWADSVLYHLLADKLEANPDLIAEHQSQPAVKKPVGPYFMWMADNRSSIVSSLGNAHAKEVTKKASELWAGLSNEVKEDYKQKAKKAKEEYDALVKKDTGATQKRARSSPVPAAKKVKRVSAYVLFLKDTRPKVASENPTMKFGELSKKVAELWAEASAEDKAKYEKQAVEANAASTAEAEADTADGNGQKTDEVPAKRRKPAAKKAAKGAADEKVEKDEKGSGTPKSTAKKAAPKKAAKDAEKGTKDKATDENGGQNDEKKKAKRKPGPKKGAKDVAKKEEVPKKADVPKKEPK